MSVWQATVQERGAGVNLVMLEMTDADGRNWATSLYVDSHSLEDAKEETWEHLERMIGRMEEVKA